MLISILSRKIPYILMKPNEEEPKIKERLKVKKLNCVLLRAFDKVEGIFDQFFKYTL